MLFRSASRVTRLPQVALSPVMWTTIRMANYRGKFNVESVNPLKQAGKIKCPVFLVHGTEDQVIAHNHSRDIHSALLGDKEIWIVEGGSHARSIRDRHTKREYIERLVRFFNEKLKGAPKGEVPALVAVD